MTYTALHQPAEPFAPDNREFETEKKALTFVQEWALARVDKYGGNVESFVAEWLVIPTAVLEKCSTLGDLFIAVGFDRVMMTNCPRKR